MHLPLDNHRVDHVAEIVRGGKAFDSYAPGLGINFHLAGIGPRRVGKVGRVIERGLLQPRLDLLQRLLIAGFIVPLANLAAHALVTIDRCAPEPDDARDIAHLAGAAGLTPVRPLGW